MAIIEDHRPLADAEGSSRATRSRALYEAELALHDARQSGVDAWVKAAADHLHCAVTLYRAGLH